MSRTTATKPTATKPTAQELEFMSVNYRTKANPNADIDFDLSSAINSALEDKRITANKDKISTAELVIKFPDGITVNKIELRGDKDKRYVIMLFEEDENLFYCGGMKFATFFAQLHSECKKHDCTIHDYLYKKPIKIKIGLKTSKNGYEYVTIEPAK